MNFIDFSFKLFEYIPDKFAIWRYKNALLGLGYSHIKLTIPLLGFRYSSSSRWDNNDFETFSFYNFHFCFNRRFFICRPLRLKTALPHYTEFFNDFFLFLQQSFNISPKFYYSLYSKKFQPILKIANRLISVKTEYTLLLPRSQRFSKNFRIIASKLLSDFFDYFLFFDIFSFCFFNNKQKYAQNFFRRSLVKSSCFFFKKFRKFYYTVLLSTRYIFIYKTTPLFFRYIPCRGFATDEHSSSSLPINILTQHYNSEAVNRILEKRSLRDVQSQENKKVYAKFAQSLVDAKRVDAKTAWSRACSRALRFVKEKAALRAAKKAHLQYKRDRVEFDFLSIVSDSKLCYDLDIKFQTLSKKDHFRLARDVMLESGSLFEGPFFDETPSSRHLHILGDGKSPRSLSRERDSILAVKSINPQSHLMSPAEKERILAEIAPAKLLKENPEYAAIMQNRTRSNYYQNREKDMKIQQQAVFDEYMDRKARIKKNPVFERCPYGMFRVKRPYYRRFDYNLDRIYLDDDFTPTSTEKVPPSVLVKHKHLMNIYVNSLINQTPEAMDRIRSKFFWNHVLDNAMAAGYIYERDGKGIRKPDYRKLSQLRAIGPLDPLERIQCMFPDYIPSPIDINFDLLRPNLPINTLTKTTNTRSYLDSLSAEQKELFKEPPTFIWDNPDKNVKFIETETWDPERDLAWPKKPIKKRYWPRIRKGYIPPLHNNSSMRLIFFNANTFLFNNRLPSNSEQARWESCHNYIIEHSRLIGGFSCDETFNIGRSKSLECGTSLETYNILCFLEDEVNTYVRDSKIRKLKRKAKLAGLPFITPPELPPLSQDDVDAFLFDHDPITDQSFCFNLKNFLEISLPFRFFFVSPIDFQFFVNFQKFNWTFLFLFFDFIEVMYYSAHEDVFEFWSTLDNIYSLIDTPHIFEFKKIKLYSDIFGFCRMFLLPSFHKKLIKHKISRNLWAFKHPSNIFWRLSKKDFIRRGFLRQQSLNRQLALLAQTNPNFNPFFDIAFKHRQYSIFPQSTSFFSYFDFSSFFEWLVIDPSILNLNACLEEFQSWSLDSLPVSLGISLDIGSFYEWGVFFSLIDDLTIFIADLQKNLHLILHNNVVPDLESSITILRPDILGPDKVMFHFNLGKNKNLAYNFDDFFLILSDISKNLVTFQTLIKPYLLLLSLTNLDASSFDNLLEARFFMLHGYKTTNFFDDYWLFQIKESFYLFILGRLEEFAHASRLVSLSKESHFFSTLHHNLQKYRAAQILTAKAKEKEYTISSSVFIDIPDDLIPLNVNLPQLPIYLNSSFSDFNCHAATAFKDFF